MVFGLPTGSGSAKSQPVGNCGDIVTIAVASLSLDRWSWIPLAAFMPGSSLSGQMMQGWPFSADQSLLSQAPAPPDQVTTTQPSGVYCAAASSVFSPSTISTGAIGRLAAISEFSSGRPSPSPALMKSLPSQTMGRISLPSSLFHLTTAPYADPSGFR